MIVALFFIAMFAGVIAIICAIGLGPAAQKLMTFLTKLAAGLLLAACAWLVISFAAFEIGMRL